jgi:hypothetical protein
MNQDTTKGKPKAETRSPGGKPPQANGAPNGGTPVPSPPAKIEINPMLLSQSLARDLERIPEAEWFKIESVPWRVGFTRDMAEGVRFVDAVANVVNQHGGLFASPNLDRRRDLEESSQEIVDAFRVFIRTTVKVAKKLNLTNILERYWRVLSAYGAPPKKADAVKAGPKPDAAKKDGGGPAEAA